MTPGHSILNEKLPNTPVWLPLNKKSASSKYEHIYIYSTNAAKPYRCGNKDLK